VPVKAHAQTQLSSAEQAGSTYINAGQANNPSVSHSATARVRHHNLSDAEFLSQRSPSRIGGNTPISGSPLRHEQHRSDNSSTSSAAVVDDRSMTQRSRSSFKPDDSDSDLTEPEVNPHRAPTLDIASNQPVLPRVNSVPVSVSRLGGSIKNDPLTNGWVQGWCIFWYVVLTLFTPVWGFFNSYTLDLSIDPWVILFVLYLLFVARVLTQFGTQYHLIRKEGQRKEKKDRRTSQGGTDAQDVRMQNLTPAR